MVVIPGKSKATVFFATLLVLTLNTMTHKKSACLASAVLSLIIVLVSCSKENNAVHAPELKLPDTPYSYHVANDNLPTLGRVLFYDKNLSLNGTVSCGSCHKQALAFADVKRFSTGFHSDKTSRNTPPIQNIAPQGQALFWDGRERDLKTMSTQPFFNHMEMGLFDANMLVQIVNDKAYYEPLFADAFNESGVSLEKINTALASFLTSIRSDNSRFERSAFGGLSALSEKEKDGQNLFFGKYNCGSCHNLFTPRGYSIPFNPNDTMLEMVNIGLDRTYADKGLGEVTGNSDHNGRFKIPNLRNVELTAPYMHDGRFATLEEVIDHYSNQVEAHENLDFRLKDAFGKPLVQNISEGEKEALIAFLKSLTDASLVTDVRFSNPFINQ